MSHRWKITAAAILLVAAQIGNASDRFETMIRSRAWGKDVLVLRKSDDSRLQFLLANGPLEECGITTQAGGIVIVKRKGGLKQYGCWQSIVKEHDSSVWIHAKLHNGDELIEPLSSFSKKPYESTVVGTFDLWSEENYQALGKRISGHFAQVQHRIRVISALAPSFNDKEKADAAACILEASNKLQTYMKVSELIVAEHEKQASKWSSRGFLAAPDLAEKRADMRVVVDMAEALAPRTYQLDAELQRCLKSKQVPFQ